jgi:hypothetical protein
MWPDPRRRPRHLPDVPPPPPSERRGRPHGCPWRQAGKPVSAPSRGTDAGGGAWSHLLTIALPETGSPGHPRGPTLPYTGGACPGRAGPHRQRRGNRRGRGRHCVACRHEPNLETSSQRDRAGAYPTNQPRLTRCMLLNRRVSMGASGATAGTYPVREIIGKSLWMIPPGFFCKQALSN